MPETKKYYHNLDVDNNKVINPLLNPLTTVQRTAVGTLLGLLDEGYVCFDTTLNQQYFWDGAAWITTGGGSQNLQQVVNIGNGISNFGGIGNASIQSTNFTNGRTLYLNDNGFPTIRIVDNANASNFLQIDLDTLNIDGVSYNWSSIVNPPTGTLVALPFTTDHLATTNNEYVIGDLVWYAGNVYRCIANNDSLQPNLAPAYWTLLGAGFPLVQQPSDWNSTSGNNQILNKPIIPTGTVTSVATSAPITGGTITTTGTIGITQSGAASDGYLSSGDWTTFNNKVGGSGTTNYVPKFSNTGTPATIADSQIFDNGTSVGIGTITPSASFKLDVVGNIRASQFGYFGNNEVRINTSTSGYMELYDSTEKKFIVGNGATDVASFRTYNGNIFQFDNNGDFIPLQLARFSSQVFKSVGTDTHNVIQSSPIINATGGTTLVRGFYYDPNLTSTTGVTNVAFENANGDIIHRNLATGGADEMVTVDSVGKLKKQAISTGSVTSVTATSPITSSGGTTPDISTSMATNKLIGRSTAGVGVMEEITVGTGLSLSAGTLSSTAEGILHGTASGTDTYTVTIAGATAYADGDAYLIRFPNGNTGTATINISGFGAVGLYRNNDGPVIGGDIWNGSEMLCIYNSTTGGFQLIGTSPNAMYAYVTNDDSVTITKGQVVYAFGGQGDRMTVKLANNIGDSTSAQTVGVVLSTSIAANQKGVIITQGLLDGLSILPTATYADGDPLYLGSTAGSITNVKPYAPNHLVYLGNVTTASNGAAGRWYVRVQNGYELDELHNVQAQSPTVNDVLYYFGGSPGQWKTASLSSILGYTPVGPNDTDYEYLMMSSFRTTYNY